MENQAIEQCILLIDSVLYCKVISSGDEIREIHILSDKRRSPKQISRDVQSALISKYNLDVDHKKISIAQVDDDAFCREFRLEIRKVGYQLSGKQAEVTVVLQRRDDEVYEGRSSGTYTAQNVNRLIAKATLRAVENFLHKENLFVLEDVKMVEISGMEVVVVGVIFVTENGELQLSGSSIVGRDKEQAVVKATLDALNRSIVKYYDNVPKGETRTVDPVVQCD